MRISQPKLVCLSGTQRQPEQELPRGESVPLIMGRSRRRPHLRIFVSGSAMSAIKAIWAGAQIYGLQGMGY